MFPNVEFTSSLNTACSGCSFSPWPSDNSCTCTKVASVEIYQEFTCSNYMYLKLLIGQGTFMGGT